MLDNSLTYIYIYNSTYPSNSSWTYSHTVLISCLCWWMI